MSREDAANAMLANKASRSSFLLSYEKRGASRAKVACSQEELDRTLLGIMQRYDDDCTGTLDRTQVYKLLTDLNNCQAPEMEEIDYVVRNYPNGVPREEIMNAISTYRAMKQNRPKLEKAMSDVGMGDIPRLTYEQVYSYLEHLNEGDPVCEGNVRWIFQQVDLDRDGLIDKWDLIEVATIWYAFAPKWQEEPNLKNGVQSSCCSVQ
eukprot:TRINITY_DN13123_c0_g1_i1.p1 TRINITY_DN13123_c0_g1~~TRINITY_DN13123_c0_g1_i1.p1  ORF type:complete len:207 (+),score=42.87 TRINITY_DN13123_c0_g1_i1:73-693(+)